MKFSDVELLPAVVVDAEDPKKLGRVKCIIAGKTDPDKIKTSSLPWCMPLISFGYQKMSKPMYGQKVWALCDKSNYYGYYYFPAVEMNANTAMINDADDYEVIVSRPGDGFGAQMFYNSDEGFVTRIGENNSIELTPEGNIISTDGNVECGIRNASIYLGNADTEYEPMVKGNKLKQLLSNLAVKLESVSTVAGSNAYTTPLSQPLAECAMAINDVLEEINSDKCNVN